MGIKAKPKGKGKEKATKTTHVPEEEDSPEESVTSNAGGE
jgi:hypothetical protein